jgi:hypothetical protein
VRSNCWCLLIALQNLLNAPQFFWLFQNLMNQSFISWLCSVQCCFLFSASLRYNCHTFLSLNGLQNGLLVINSNAIKPFRSTHKGCLFLFFLTEFWANSLITVVIWQRSIISNAFLVSSIWSRKLISFYLFQLQTVLFTVWLVLFVSVWETAVNIERSFSCTSTFLQSLNSASNLLKPFDSASKVNPNFSVFSTLFLQ